MRYLSWILAFVFLAGCQTEPTFKKEEAIQEILRLHETQRDFHFEKRAADFAGLLSDDHISVNRGVISRPSYDENLQRFSNYFNSVEFIKWDDLTAPVIRFSEDGSLAYSIVDKEVILQYEGEEGVVLYDTTHYAWTAIYRKKPEGWKIENVTSTNE